MWLLFLPLLIPALAAVAVRPLAACLEPRQATWLLTLAAVALAACSTTALALLAAYAAARTPMLAALGGYSPSVIGRGDPIPVAAGVAAALALTGAATAFAVMARNRARALAESYRRAAGLQPDDGVVVVPGQDIEAYALPGWPGRIVVSGSLLEHLDSRGQAALLAHEQAHLTGRHHWFVTMTLLAAAANPLLLPVHRAVEYTVERWADERAAAVTGDRRLVARTIGQVALLDRPRRRPPGLVLGMALTRARRRLPATRARWRRVTGTRRPRVTGVRRLSVAWAGPVPRRVAALLAAPPPRRTLLLAACIVIVALTGGAALDAARDLHALVELAQAGR